jgi:hypothetical protein
VFVLGVIREEWRNDRERLGLLLRLLLAEIRHNAGVMRRTREESRLEQIGSMKLSHMKIETWRATQTRAVQLVPSELLICLEDYYTPLETLLTRLKYEDSVDDAGARW